MPSPYKRLRVDALSASGELKSLSASLPPQQIAPVGFSDALRNFDPHLGVRRIHSFDRNQGPRQTKTETHLPQ